MRAPRYQFPEHVRSTTRTMAARMVREGSIARSPDDLDVWVSGHPDVKQSLEKGGFGTAFGSHDLFPLLQVFVTQEGGAAPEAEARPRSPRGVWLVVAALGVAILAGVLLGLLA